MISKADAIFSAMEALRVHRMIHQHEPASIRIRCGEAGAVECVAGWSKSSVNNKTQTVFLVIPQSDSVAALLPSAQVIEWGETEFVVRGEIEAPKEPGSYWLLPVREA